MLTRDAGWPSLDHRCEGPLCIARITIREHCGVVARARCMAGPALMCRGLMEQQPLPLRVQSRGRAALARGRIFVTITEGLSPSRFVTREAELEANISESAAALAAMQRALDERTRRAAAAEERLSVLELERATLSASLSALQKEASHR